MNFPHPFIFFSCSPLSRSPRLNSLITNNHQHDRSVYLFNLTSSSPKCMELSLIRCPLRDSALGGEEILAKAVQRRRGKLRDFHVGCCVLCCALWQCVACRWAYNKNENVPVSHLVSENITIHPSSMSHVVIIVLMINLLSSIYSTKGTKSWCEITFLNTDVIRDDDEWRKIVCKFSLWCCWCGWREKSSFSACFNFAIQWISMKLGNFNYSNSSCHSFQQASQKTCSNAHSTTLFMLIFSLNLIS